VKRCLVFGSRLRCWIWVGLRGVDDNANYWSAWVGVRAGKKLGIGVIGEALRS